MSRHEDFPENAERSVDLVKRLRATVKVCYEVVGAGTKTQEMLLDEALRLTAQLATNLTAWKAENGDRQ